MHINTTIYVFSLHAVYIQKKYYFLYVYLLYMLYKIPLSLYVSASKILGPIDEMTSLSKMTSK